ncbi:GNAT family N-acetyltransferase [Saccharibacillus alkalitolerans]|uniref:GNAT family N-acetyltransferase n=1 Tax=Saccharibacillus alkalitolerans TaxID=2705290 RepID=A0ABX0FDM7_9BACL|nr:N-acetyltransferase [Saccharibacillus alkalitolerans]NGZ76437.1 GNAT family N-acetyltransferase [Saccharibacillus alkalitolerans]
MTTELRKCGVSDLPALRQIGIETFSETFGAQNKPENMRAYLEKAFHEQQLEKELSTEGSAFFFLSVEGELAGFLKVNVGVAQSEPMGDDALEVERIYVRSAFQKKGLGKALIDQAFRLAEEQGKTKVWLGVWEKNGGAVAFYEKMGFERIGAHSFLMGDEEQTDWIMTKMLDKSL